MVKNVYMFIGNWMSGILSSVKWKIDDLNRNIESSKIISAKNLINHNNHHGGDIHDVEFSVFSQWGEDGIIQYIISKIPIKNKTFIEFGVGDYSESNTRFLLQNNNWKGLIIDSSLDNIGKAKKKYYYWAHDLRSECNLITKENINSLIHKNGISGEIGLLSVDIDGNDYWILESIDSVKPVIVICEYNSVFGSERCISVPYKKDFYRYNEHYSGLYFGCSIGSLRYLMDKKGYYYIGSCSNGVNAFFVKNDLVHHLGKDFVNTDFMCSKTRESKDKDGNLNFLNPSDRYNIIKDLPVVNVVTGDTEPL